MASFSDWLEWNVLKGKSVLICFCFSFAVSYAEMDGGWIDRNHSELTWRHFPHRILQCPCQKSFLPPPPLSPQEPAFSESRGRPEVNYNSWLQYYCICEVKNVVGYPFHKGCTKRDPVKPPHPIFPLPPGHTVTMHFPASLAGRCVHMTDSGQ